MTTNITEDHRRAFEALTSGEAGTLHWTDVDLEAGELRLADIKTGGRRVPLAPSAVRLLASLPRDADNPWVIAGKLPGSYLTDLQPPGSASGSGPSCPMYEFMTFAILVPHHLIL